MATKRNTAAATRPQAAANGAAPAPSYNAAALQAAAAAVLPAYNPQALLPAPAVVVPTSALPAHLAAPVVVQAAQPSTTRRKPKGMGTYTANTPLPFTGKAPNMRAQAGKGNTPKLWALLQGCTTYGQFAAQLKAHPSLNHYSPAGFVVWATQRGALHPLGK